MEKTLSKRHKARELALQGMYQYDLGEKKLNEIIQFDWVNKKRIPSDALLYAEHLISETIKHQLLIDQLISENLEHWDLDKIFSIDRNILRFSVYSLLFQNEIPYVVIINEAIVIARKFGGNNSFRFVNGVLDGIQKKKINVELANTKKQFEK